MNYYLTIDKLTLVTDGIPDVGTRIFIPMGEGFALKAFSNYPDGYWGASVVAVSLDTEEWVVRFDKTYGELWGGEWKFGDNVPQTDLKFKRTGREIIYYGEIEPSDCFYKANTEARTNKRRRRGSIFHI